jgi:predicted DNA-binding transcriptional regulator YafY
MADTSMRMLRLLSLLQAHRFWPGPDLAARLGVSERTLRRDVDRLRELGYPVDATRGVAGGYQLRSGAAMPPLLLDDEEAVAIAVGLRAAAGGAVQGIEETSVRALAKVVTVLPPRLRRRVEALGNYTVSAGGSGPAVDALDLTVAAQACRDTERLRFGYLDERRHVEPHRLVTLGRRWYLVAWDLDRADWRIFRLDRLSAPEPTGARFRPRAVPGGDAAVFVRERFGALASRYDVSVLVHAPAATVEAVTVHTGGTVTEVDGSSCRLGMRVDDLNWPAFVLGVLDVPFEVERPADLRDVLRGIGELFLKAT